MKQIFVTGANGFIGQVLVEYLTKQGYEVFALVRKNKLPSFRITPNTHVVYGDLLDKKSLEDGIPKNAYVINLAANPYHQTLSHAVNVDGTQLLIDACKKKHVTKIVHISSQATKIEKKGVYATTKILSEQIVQESKIPYIIVKPSLVYGSGEKGLFVKIASLARKLPFIPVFGDGRIRLNPIHVDDLCILLERLIKDAYAAGISYDVGSKESVTYNDLYQGIANKLANKPKLVHIPTPIGLALAYVFSILPNPPIYRDNVLGSTQSTNCDPSAILKKYSFTPRKLSIGMNEVFSPIKKHVCVVGLGKMGMLHLTLLQTFEDVEIVALVDVNPKLYATVKSMGLTGKYYPNVDDALKNEKIDAIYITTPTFAHAQILETAMKKNIHVFVEKPVTLNAEQIKKLRSIQTKSIVQVGYTLLYTRTFMELKRIIEDKRYGNIISFSAKFSHGEVLEAKKGWMFVKKLSGGGVLMNPGPHLFSILNLLFGVPTEILNAEVKKIYSTEVEDEAHLELEYKNIRGNVSISWSKKNTPIAEYVVDITFENARIVTNGNSMEIIVKGKNKTYHSQDFALTKNIPVININPDAYGEAYYLENYMFMDAVRNGKSTAVNTLSFAFDTEQTIFRIYQKSGVL